MNIKHFAIVLLAVVSTSFAEVKNGDAAPDFSLTSVDGKKVSLSDYKGKVVVLEWFNLGCPFVQKHYNNKDMQGLQSEYTGKGVVWLSINSTNPNHKDYLTPEKAAAQVKQKGIASTAMLQDADGKVGQLYGAKSTPHMFVINAEGKLVYQGAIDDNPSPKADPKAAKNFVRSALDEVLAGKAVTQAQTKQYGCGVKYAD
jgi:peroxiredoxin